MPTDRATAGLRFAPHRIWQQHLPEVTAKENLWMSESCELQIRNTCQNFTRDNRTPPSSRLPNKPRSQPHLRVLLTLTHEVLTSFSRDVKPPVWKFKPVPNKQEWNLPRRAQLPHQLSSGLLKHKEGYGNTATVQHNPLLWAMDTKRKNKTRLGMWRNKTGDVFVAVLWGSIHAHKDFVLKSSKYSCFHLLQTPRFLPFPKPALMRLHSPGIRRDFGSPPFCHWTISVGKEIGARASRANCWDNSKHRNFCKTFLLYHTHWVHTHAVRCLDVFQRFHRSL